MKQYFNFTVCPFTQTSLVLGGGLYEVLFCEFGTSICFSMSAASSAEALGMIPGSLKDVRNRELITNTYSTPPTIGMAGVIFLAKYGQLKIENKKLCVSCCITKNVL